MLLTLVQQFAHLFDRERLVLGRERFLALALIQKRATAGVFADGRSPRRRVLGRHPSARGRGWGGDHRVVVFQLRARGNVRDRISRAKMARRKLTRSKYTFLRQ